VLCIAHVMTVIGTNYQFPTIIAMWRSEPTFMFSVNFGTFISPIVVLLLVRRFCLLVGIYGLPVLLIFIFRMYDVWQYYWFNINSMLRQKGDALGFLTMLFEMISVPIAAICLLALIVSKVTGTMARARKS